MHAYTYIYISIDVCLSIYIYLYLSISIHLSIDLYRSISIYINLLIDMYMYMYKYIGLTPGVVRPLGLGLSLGALEPRTGVGNVN